MATTQKKKKKFRLKIHEDYCKSCRLCVQFCPKAVLEMTTDRLNIKGVPFVVCVRPADYRLPDVHDRLSRRGNRAVRGGRIMGKRVLMAGNEALAEGAIRAGCDAYYGYPITPQNELTAYMATNMPRHGRVFIQAESEIAAINMVFGSAAAGKRAMTSSSSPGISLKQEGISYMAGGEMPGLIVNIQRSGPGLGGIDPSQADYFQATRGGGHGGYRTIVLAPYCAGNARHADARFRARRQVSQPGDDPGRRPGSGR